MGQQLPLTSCDGSTLGPRVPWKVMEGLWHCLQPRVLALPHPLLSPSLLFLCSRLIPLQITWCAQSSNSWQDTNGLIHTVRGSR